MIKRLGIFAIGMLATMCLWAQPSLHGITNGEYFWDTDPGVGNGTLISASDGTFDEKIESVFANNATFPSGAGAHKFGLRIHEANGSWSSTFYTMVFRDQNTVGTRSLQISQAEYWWDADPGQGNGTTLFALDGNLNEAIEGLFATVTVPSSDGAHKFSIRVKEADNQWSPVFSTILEVDISGAVTRPTSVVQAEFWWDADPGEGNGSVVLALDGNLDAAVEGLFAAMSAPFSVGPYKFSLRVKAVDGTWSPVFSTAMEVTLAGGALRSVEINQAEYFWDTDPGIGNGTPLLAFDGALNEAIEALYANGITFPASPGEHRFNVRVKDPHNHWSDNFSTIVYRGENTTSIRSTHVMQAEYFWDTDPGQGNASPLLALDGNLNEEIEELLANGISFPGTSGGHTFNVRTADIDGNWSSLFTTMVYRDTNTNTLRSARIMQAEFWWDIDPRARAWKSIFGRGR